MATINQQMAEQIAKNDGIYPGDPQCYAVFKYWNPYFDKVDWAVAYDAKDFARYSEFRKEILWKRES